MWNVSGTILQKEIEDEKSEIYSSSELLAPFLKKGGLIKHLPIDPRELANDFVSMIWFLGEPSCHETLPYYWNCYKKSVTKSSIFLSSCGGDFLLGACVQYYLRESKRYLHSSYQPSFLKRWWLMVSSLHLNQSFFAHVRRAKTNPSHLEYLEGISYFSMEELKKVSPYLHRFYIPDILIQKFYHMYHDCSDMVAHSYFDVKTLLVDGHLSPIQNIAHAHGAQVCFPFLYLPLVEYLASQQHASDAEEKQGLFLVNKLFDYYFPSTRKFEPIEWAEEELLDFLLKPPWPSILRLLLNGVLVESGYISKRWMRWATSIKTPSIRIRRQLWSIICLEVWYRIFIFHPMQSVIPEVPLEDFLRST